MVEIGLWDDNPATIDLLGFEAVIAPIIEILHTDDLDPVTVGVHGAWGSGKSTILGLLEQSLETEAGYFVVPTAPWEYESHQDVKGTLIAAVLKGLEKQLSARQAWHENLRGRAEKLLQRVSWSRVTAAVARGAVTMSWNPEELLSAFNPREEEQRSLVGFKEEFAKLIEPLTDLKRVVVLVDDLDRCLPGTVVSTLETIKLFLSVRKMVFVIAADQELVRDAIAAYLPPTNSAERFAANYLHKIIQVPVFLPQLRFVDAEGYIGLLLASRRADKASILSFVTHCSERRAAGLAPLLAGFADGSAAPEQDAVRLAAQVAYGLGAQRLRNPREIKRFLNAIGIRASIAQERGIAIEAPVLAKLMVLEDRFRPAFDALISREPSEQAEFMRRWERWARGEEKAPLDQALEGTQEWAGSEPSLADLPITSYLTLAAALVASPFMLTLSPELVDLALRMLSESAVDRELAFQAARARPTDDRRQVGTALRDAMRRADTILRHAEALVELSGSDADLALEFIDWLRELDRTLVDPAVGVTLAASGKDAFRSFAGELVSDDRVSEETRIAIREALS